MSDPRGAAGTSMIDAPRYRLWPPIALGVPLTIGIATTANLGDPLAVPTVSRPLGWILLGVFIGWNGWSLALIAAHQTGLLPGGATRSLIDRGPFRVSRNPLYLGLIALDIAIALLWPSGWALLLVPAGVLALRWGAIVPEERYLHVKFGAQYDDYTHRVPRWLPLPTIRLHRSSR